MSDRGCYDYYYILNIFYHILSVCNIPPSQPLPPGSVGLSLKYYNKPILIYAPSLSTSLPLVAYLIIVFQLQRSLGVLSIVTPHISKL